MLHAFRAFRRPGCIHGSISAADDDNIFPDIKVAVFRLEIRQEFQGVDRFAFLQSQHARLRCADRQDNRRIAGIFQHLKIGDLRIQINLDAGLLKKRRILINGLRRDPEFRDHVADHTAQTVCLLKQGGLHPRPAEEICRRHSGRTAADHRSLPASCYRGCRKLLHERVVSVLRRDQLHPADIDGFLIEIAGAFAHTRMGAYCSRNERERILLCNDLHGLFIFSVLYKLQIRRDILMDRTSLPAGCGKAVQQRHLLVHLPGRERFHRFHMMGIGLRRIHQTLHRLRVHAAEYGAFFFQEGCHLVHPVISARLQESRRHRHRPDARLHNVFDIVVIRAARIGDTELSVKVFRQFCRHRNGQRVQGFAGHVHLPAGQFILLYIHRECIGDLHAELQVPLRAHLHQALQHRHRVRILQIILKMEIPERHVVVSHIVHHLPRVLIAQQRRIAFDKCMESFLRDQVHGNALDLLRRAAVQGGNGHGIADISGDPFDILFRYIFKQIRMLQQIRLTGSEDIRILGVLHRI